MHEQGRQETGCREGTRCAAHGNRPNRAAGGRGAASLVMHGARCACSPRCAA